MLSSIVYCFNDKVDKLIQLASSNGLQANRNDTWSVSITGSKCKHDNFLELFENNSDFGILYADETGRDQIRCQSKMKRVQSSQGIKSESATESKTTESKTTESKTTQSKPTESKTTQSKPTASKTSTTNTSYGHTAVYMAQYYNYPSINISLPSPVIAIISLGGGYQLSDLQTYWKTICGLSTYPTVINVPVGQSTVPKYTGSDSDLENTLDLEICGAIAHNATLLFIAGVNTTTGFYNAFSAAINGVTVAGKRYKPTIISCSWDHPSQIIHLPN